MNANKLVSIIIIGTIIYNRAIEKLFIFEITVNTKRFRKTKNQNQTAATIYEGNYMFPYIM